MEESIVSTRRLLQEPLVLPVLRSFIGSRRDFAALLDFLLASLKFNTHATSECQTIWQRVLERSNGMKREDKIALKSALITDPNVKLRSLLLPFLNLMVSDFR